MINDIDTIMHDSLVINLDISIWSGRAKLRRDDIPNADNLPPDTLASMGSKKLIDPAMLTPFNTLRARAATSLDKIGVRFLGGWIIHKGMHFKARGILDDICAEFDEALRQFLNKYDDVTEDWLQSFPEWSGIIRAALPARLAMIGKFRFAYTFYAVAPVQGDATLETQVSRLGNAATSELVAMVKDLYHEVFEGRDTITKRGLRPIRTIIEKLDAVSYMHPGLVNVKMSLQDELTLLEAGVQDKDTVLRFKRFLLSLLNPAGIELLFENGPMTASMLEVLLSGQPESEPESSEPASDVVAESDDETENNLLNNVGLW